MLDDTGRSAPSRDCSRAVRRGARIESSDRRRVRSHRVGRPDVGYPSGP